MNLVERQIDIISGAYALVEGGRFSSGSLFFPKT